MSSQRTRYWTPGVCRRSRCQLETNTLPCLIGSPGRQGSKVTPTRTFVKRNQTPSARQQQRSFNRLGSVRRAVTHVVEAVTRAKEATRAVGVGLDKQFARRAGAESDGPHKDIDSPEVVSVSGEDDPPAVVDPHKAGPVGRRQPCTSSSGRKWLDVHLILAEVDNPAAVGGKRRATIGGALIQVEGVLGLSVVS